MYVYVIPTSRLCRNEMDHMLACHFWLALHLPHIFTAIPRSDTHCVSPLIAGVGGPLIKVYTASTITKGSKSDNHISAVKMASSVGRWGSSGFQYSAITIKTVANFRLIFVYLPNWRKRYTKMRRELAV